jgi:hypothetical protein
MRKELSTKPANIESTQKASGVLCNVLTRERQRRNYSSRNTTTLSDIRNVYDSTLLSLHPSLTEEQKFLYELHNFYYISAVPLTRRDLVPTAGRDGQSGTYYETKKLILLK